MPEHDHRAVEETAVRSGEPSARTGANTPAMSNLDSTPSEPITASARNPQRMPAPAEPLIWPSKVFDPHHPPADELINECVHCGFCLPTCPTYLLWHEEMDSPRGRIYLMKMGLEGEVDRMDDTYVRHFDQCLGCMACVSACPSGVKYDRLIESTRAQLERHYSAPAAGPALSRAHLFGLSLSREAAGAAATHVAVPALRTALAAASPGPAEAAAQTAAGYGSAAARGFLALHLRPPPAGARAAAGQTAPEGRTHPGLRAAHAVCRGERRHRAGAGRRRLRGGDSAHAGLLRRLEHARRPGAGRTALRPQDDHGPSSASRWTVSPSTPPAAAPT